MSKLLRMVLTWVLAVALPLQGYAVHAMAACGPAHHQGQEAAHQMPHSHEDATEAHEHGGHDHAQLSQSSHGEIAKSVKSGHAHKCSACASCCHLTAMVSTVIHFDVIGDADKNLDWLCGDAQAPTVLGGTEKAQ